MAGNTMMRRIQVAMVILEYAPIVGGAQRQLALLAPYLKALDVDVTVLTRGYPGLSPFEIIDGVPVYRLPAPGPKALASLVYSAASLHQLRRLKPDLVHAFSLFSPLTTAVAYKTLSRTPVVVKILRGGKLGDIYRLRHKFLGERRLSAFRRRVDAFISISQEISTELEAVRIEAPKSLYIPNGVDTSHYQPVTTAMKNQVRPSLGLPSGPLVVYTGRLVPEKGVDVLLSAWPSVRQTHPHAALVIVGDGEAMAQLRVHAGEGVYFTGAVEDVRPYLQAADLFILPSSDEGLSNSMLEAMAAGLGVVCTAVGGAPDLITHQANGWLIPPGDVVAIQEALTHLLAEPASILRLGRAARQTIVERFALPVVAGQLRDLYGRVIV